MSYLFNLIVSYLIIVSAQNQVRFWGWSENKREEEMDLAELSQRVKEGKSLYGESDQPEHVQASAYRNSAFSQLKFRECRLHHLSIIQD